MDEHGDMTDLMNPQAHELVMVEALDELGIVPDLPAIRGGGLEPVFLDQLQAHRQLPEEATAIVHDQSHPGFAQSRLGFLVFVSTEPCQFIFSSCS